MPRPKHDDNPPPDLLSRLPGKPIITTGDKLAALQTMFHRCEIGWRDLHLSIINAIREDIRLSAWRKREAQKGSAPVRPEAPSRPEQRGEARPIVAQACAGYKIDLDHYGPLLVKPETGRITVTHESICALVLTSDQARQLAALLEEAADDVDRDGAVREQYAKLLEATTE